MENITGDQVLDMLEKKTELPELPLEQIQALEVSDARKEQLIEKTLLRMVDRYLKPKKKLRPKLEDVARDVRFCHELIRTVNQAAAAWCKRLDEASAEIAEKDQVINALFSALQDATPRSWATGAVPPEHAFAWAESIEDVFGVRFADSPEEVKVVCASEADMRREIAAHRASQALVRGR